MLEERFAPAPAAPTTTPLAGWQLARARARIGTATHARPARAHARRLSTAHAGENISTGSRASSTSTAAGLACGLPRRSAAAAAAAHRQRAARQPIGPLPPAAASDEAKLWHRQQGVQSQHSIRPGRQLAAPLSSRGRRRTPPGRRPPAHRPAAPGRRQRRSQTLALAAGRQDPTPYPFRPRPRLVYSGFGRDLNVLNWLNPFPFLPVPGNG